ncbi:MAG TPA: D-arabinono-1,4-lactone oxidase [Solirubrobacterales bacterium]|jgi:L-gulonolactone oxidase|nr:D-arabinono-1,4-lactone oxidase [Solirubrobacterales bacterium]
MSEWRNWTGDQRCVPARIERPSDRGDLIESVKRAGDQGLTVRAVGSGHSFTDAACTGGVLFEMDGLDRVLDVQRDAGLVKVEAGIGLRALSELIWGHGMALENLGDIDKQTISGAVATGTHGTGSRFRNVSSQIEAMELVLSDGTLLEVSATSEPDLLPAVRVGLGALGVIATITLRTVPTFTVRRTDSPQPLDETLERLEELADGSDHFEFYVFPHTDVALLRRSERTEEPPDPRHRAIDFGQEVVLENWVMGAIARAGRRMPSKIPRLSRFVASQLGKNVKMDRSYRVFASRRMVRFTEMEYAIPRRNATEAIPRVLEAAERADPPVGFPIEVRFVAGDDSMLSPAHERDACYIAVHQYQGMAWESYFRSVESIMDSYRGRPHWGKRHFQTAATLAERYPRFDDFLAARNRLDPEGTFRNQYLDRVLGPPTRSALQAAPT